MRFLIFLLTLFCLDRVSSDQMSNEDCKAFINSSSPCKCTFSKASGQPNLNVSDCSEVKINLDTMPSFSTVSFQRLTSLLIFTPESVELERNFLKEVTLLVEDVKTVNISSKAFNQLVVGAVFKNIRNLNLEEKSFYSCWGTVWFFNVSSGNTTEFVRSTYGVFSSSDIVQLNDLNPSETKFKVHRRPKLTPLQKATTIYSVLNRVEDMEITIYALLALCGLIVVCLIILTTWVLRNTDSKTVKYNVTDEENLPDVVPATKTRRAPNIKPRNPVTKISRISRALCANKREGKQHFQLKLENRYKTAPRPPIALP